MSASCSREPRYQVICVCGGYGFPLGNASAARITMIGRALQEAGISFRVLHCGPSPTSINNKRAGTYEGIPFEYTTAVRRPDGKLARVLIYVWGLAGLTIRLLQVWPKRRLTIMYLYVMDGPINLYTGALCKWLGITIVQELCEWVPVPSCSRFNAWLYRKRVFTAATGALVISKAIEERVRKLAATTNPDLVVYRAPALVNSRRFAAACPAPGSRTGDVPEFVYCGDHTRDVSFIIQALAFVKLSGYRCRLRIIGEYAEEAGPQLLRYGLEQGLSSGDLIMAKCVDHDHLATLYKTATALLMPLWNDEKSVTRLPNKMSEYLASGRPVITSGIGDVTDYLTDNVNAYFADPGDERRFAKKMIDVLDDPSRATDIGMAGQEVCCTRLDYRAYVSALSRFFVHCIECECRRRLGCKARQRTLSGAYDPAQVSRVRTGADTAQQE